MGAWNSFRPPKLFRCFSILQVILLLHTRLIFQSSPFSAILIEKVVHLVDPIGTFLDTPNPIVPFSISPRSATCRHLSPFRTRPANLVKVRSQSSSVPNSLLSPFLTSSPFRGISKHENKLECSSCRSISLKRESDSYALGACILENADKLRPTSPQSDTPSRSLFTSNQADEKEESNFIQHNRHTHLERGISPVRDQLDIQSLSQDFQRAILPGLTSLPTCNSSPSSPVSGLDSDEDHFISHTQLDDIFINPGPYISCISFSNFRSHGMRRSVAEGQIRFVTAERLLRLLRSTRNRYIPVSGSDYVSDSDQAETLEIFSKGHLESVGFSEYMDSAISKAVLDEIFLRGGVEAEYEIFGDDPEKSTAATLFTEVSFTRGRDRARKELNPISRYATPHHTLAAPVQDASQGYFHVPATTITSTPIFTERRQIPTRVEKRWESTSLIMETPVKAVDFCGCISPAFKSAFSDFILDHALSNPYNSRPYPPMPSIKLDSFNTTRLRSTTFPWLSRLGLSHMITFTDTELANFLSGFPNLIDLDLSHTRTGPVVLHTLQLLKKGRRIGEQDHQDQAPSFRSLNLSKCRGLTESSLIGFLCGDNPEQISLEEHWEDPRESIGGLEELSLYGDQTFPTPLASQDLDRLLSTCPCLLSGKLKTLDLSSIIKFNEQQFDLIAKMPAQPNLIQFGLACCPEVSLQTVRALLKEKMKMVEVLDLSGSCRSARTRLERPNRFGSRFFPILSSILLHKELIEPLCCKESNGNNVSNLRVIELDEPTLECFAGGTQQWKVAFGKGQRAWYVDLSASIKIADSKNPPSNKNYLRMAGCTLPYTRIVQRYPVFSSIKQEAKDNKERLLIKDLGYSLNGIKNSNEVMSIDIVRNNDEIGWMSRKIEILNGTGFLGRQGGSSGGGLYGFYSFCQ